jgi:hypothetical protein
VRSPIVICSLGLVLVFGCSSEISSDAAGESEEAIAGGGACSDDSMCNHGVAGLGVICVRSGANRGKCGDGCHGDDDCPGGGSCDKSTSRYACDDPLPKLGTPCNDDRFCAGQDTEGADNYDDTENLGGMGRVCSSNTKRCIVGCHKDDDCPGTTRCDTKRATPVCVKDDSGAGDNDDGDEGDPPPDEPDTKGCPAITYPSGATLQTVLDPEMTAKYARLQASSCKLPKCFIDLGNLRAADGTQQTLDTQLSEHFTLREIVATELGGKWGTKVLVDSSFIGKLEKMRELSGADIPIGSGFRSPDHQRAVCNGLCGCDQCVSNGHGGNRCGNAGGKVTCARNSRHMWGAAADMQLSYTSAARKAAIPFVYEEYGGSGPHLHIDMKACR